MLKFKFEFYFEDFWIIILAYFVVTKLNNIDIYVKCFNVDFT